MERALEGVRVLDLTQAYSGPFATMNLADHGAEIIKIERPGVGDQTRGWGPFKNGFSAYYSYINRNKKGITLNIASPEGKEIIKELVKHVDIVMENFKVGTMDKLGIGYDVLKEINPKIIYGSVSGFGLEGKYAHRPCYDIVAQATSGMMSVTGYPDGRPVKIGPSIGDNYSGAYLVIGILMALYRRTITGKGSRIDVSMVDTLFSVMENFVVQYTVGGTTPTRNGNVDPGIAPFDSFRAKDGEFVMGCGTDVMFHKLCKSMGREELADDPRFDTNDKRCQNYHKEGLKDIIEEWSMNKTVDEIEEIIVADAIPFGRIWDVPTMAESEIARDRNMLWEVYQPGMDEKIRIPGCPVKIHGEVDDIEKPAPTLGQHTEEIFKDMLGMDDKKIEELREKGVI